MTPDELDDTPFEYLIPGLLPKPWTLLVHADGGTGKTAMCQTIGKHIGQGKPLMFMVVLSTYQLVRFFG